MPELIAETLLVVEPFTHAGEQYERGDRLPLGHRWVRRVVAEQPELFRMEYAPEPVDLEWVASASRSRKAERKKREERAREEREREKLERRVELTGGYHY